MDPTESVTARTEVIQPPPTYSIPPEDPSYDPDHYARNLVSEFTTKEEEHKKKLELKRREEEEKARRIEEVLNKFKEDRRRKLEMEKENRRKMKELKRQEEQEKAKRIEEALNKHKEDKKRKLEKAEEHRRKMKELRRQEKENKLKKIQELRKLQEEKKKKAAAAKKKVKSRAETVRDMLDKARKQKQERQQKQIEANFYTSVWIKNKERQYAAKVQSMPPEPLPAPVVPFSLELLAKEQAFMRKIDQTVQQGSDACLNATLAMFSGSAFPAQTPPVNLMNFSPLTPGTSTGTPFVSHVSAHGTPLIPHISSAFTPFVSQSVPPSTETESDEEIDVVN